MTGSGVVAIVQGLLGGLAFWGVGLPGALWGSVMAFMSLVPVVGCAIIWIPASLVLFAQGNTGAGIFLLLWGVLVISSVDNVIRVFVVKGPVEMHPLLIFFSVVGGIQFAGLLGVVFGPLIVAVVQSLLEIFRGEFMGRPRPRPERAPERPMPPRAVLFDAVATLIRPWPSVGSVYARAAASRGGACPARALEAAFPPAYRELFPQRFFGRSGLQTSEPRERRWWGRVVARTFERAGCAAPSPAAVAAGVEAFARGAAWRPCAGAVETLAALRARGLKLALVSNYDARLHRVVAELGLGRVLRRGARLVRGRLGQALAAHLRRRARGARVGAAEALMVGDRPREDVAGARGRRAAGAAVRSARARRRGRIRSATCVRCRAGFPPRAGCSARPSRKVVPRPGLFRRSPSVPADARPCAGRGSRGLPRLPAARRRSRG